MNEGQRDEVPPGTLEMQILKCWRRRGDAPIIRDRRLVLLQPADAVAGTADALGTGPRDILTLVLRQAGRMIGAGATAGVAGAYALMRFPGSLLLRVHADDEIAYLATVGILTAGLHPGTLARRGSSGDPVVVL